MIRMCWYILGTCQLVKVFWYFRSNTFDACCQKKTDCCQIVVPMFLTIEKIWRSFWLLNLLVDCYDCWNCCQVLSDFSDCCHNFLIAAKNSTSLSELSDCYTGLSDCCLNFSGCWLVARIFWLLSEFSDCWNCWLMDDYDCWSCCQVLQNFAACCQDFLVIVRISWLFPGLSDCCQNFLFVVGIFRLLSGSSDCCQDFLIVVRGFCDCCQISRVVIKTF